jgi:hypothetical protein
MTLICGKTACRAVPSTQASPGVDLCKTFGILVGVEGGGMVRSAPIAVVARDRRHRT